ncbi:MAG: hypothetical protein DRQ78_05930 [Epsilonproteobacteria bacterium]|nr:MAG: hypothetical protein DRQ78_05930 [Campylobacterota bacterium]
MKSFKKYLAEADYTRFLKKNKNLTDDQRDEINKYYAKKNPQAGSSFDWQSKKLRRMTYQEFENDMLRYASGFQLKASKFKIQGKKGTDYWPIKLKSKMYLANIPLNQETATYMNSCKYGKLQVDYCIGWGDDVAYWNDHVIEEQHVPVYIIDGRRKWVVMILPDNKHYEVWDKLNNRDVSIGNPEPIPNFSIKKELLGSRMGKLYDEIREDFYEDEAEAKEIDIDDAETDYDSIIEDIDEVASQMNADQEYFDQESYAIKSETEAYYDSEIEEKEEEEQSLRNEIDAIDDEIDELTDVQGEFEDDDELESVNYDGEEYSEDEIESRITNLGYDKDELEEKISEVEGEINSLTHIRDQIDEIVSYEMDAHDEIDWVRTPPSEDDVGYNVSIPSCHEGKYADYFDLMEEHGHGGSRDRCDDDIREYVYESRYEGSSESGAEILSNNDWHHPEILNDN